MSWKEVIARSLFGMALASPNGGESTKRSRRVDHGQFAKPNSNCIDGLSLAPGQKALQW